MESNTSNKPILSPDDQRLAFNFGSLAAEAILDNKSKTYANLILQANKPKCECGLPIHKRDIARAYGNVLIRFIKEAPTLAEIFKMEAQRGYSQKIAEDHAEQRRKMEEIIIADLAGLGR